MIPSRIVLSLSVMIAGLPLASQTNRGAISGTVFDQSGAVTASATVTITNLGTNQTVRLITSPIGTYSALDLEPVEYRIEVTAPGVKRAVVARTQVDTATTT